MTLTPVHRHDGDRREIDGWFDLNDIKASYPEADTISDEEFERRRRSRKAGAIRATRNTLLRTGERRWVLESHVIPHDTGTRHAVKDRYRFLTDDQALAWLTRNGHEQTIQHWLHDLPPERGPGRPEIGGRVQVRLGGLLDAVDSYADQNACSRAEAVRALVAIGLRSA
ncbi:hypothetical protein PV682_28330 [Streptomyces niveiscabiei]|uniref:hypothetical protein n=1 Tax=Streptomyces niveiscabiei TaxID=164115 RepID=UPI0029B44F17|nr:hypothetical protein [Streptomyces niveiscabiei]MDX3385351.1 hypothetical protein [Streptomyces niveiscabiei]